MTCSFSSKAWLGAMTLGVLALVTAARAAQPEFHARRDYGDNKGCANVVAIAVGDIDGDGLSDVVCGGGQFLLNTEIDGIFKLSPSYPSQMRSDMVLLDLNGDGKLDILGINEVSVWGFTVSFGNGNATFQNPVAYPIQDSENFHTAVGDFNGDGIIDAVTIGKLGIWLITGKGNGVFNTPTLAVPGVGNNNGHFAAGDVNGDGKLDLVVGSSNGFQVLLGNGDGTFQAPVTYPTPSFDVYLADVNGDGILDVLSADSSIDITISLGQPGGTFGAPFQVSLPNGGGIAVGDVNGDGIPDLVSDGVYIAYGLGGGAFSAPYYFSNAGGATQVVLGNFRSPKLVDLVTNDAFSRVSVLLNNGKGGFIEGRTVPFQGGNGCTVQADFNGDGIPDFGIVSSSANSFFVELGTGAASQPFRNGPSLPFTEPDPTYGACVTNAADINGDGIPDVMLIVPSDRNATSLDLVPLLSTGGGHFKAAKTINAGVMVEVALYDVNGDGFADYVNLLTNQVAFGNGDGTFQAPVTFVNASVGRIQAIGSGDLNGDGKPDFVVVGQDETVVMLSQAGGGFSIAPLAGVEDSYYVAIGDLNGDGSPDILFGSGTNTMSLYFNDGHGNFTAPPVSVSTPGISSAFAPTITDLNGDGLNDIAVSDGGSTAVLTNLGNAKFSAPVYWGCVGGYSTPFFGNWHGQPASAGKPDMVLLSSGTTAILQENITK